MLSPAQVAESGARIAEVQAGGGMVPWFEGGPGDPWNHVEAAMALTAAGRVDDAKRAYAWLARTQERGGWWRNRYVHGTVLDPLRDTNLCAYVATGTWHHYLSTGDVRFLEAMSPVVEAAVEFVLGLQQPGGEVLWCVGPDGRPGPFALLAASSSIHVSLRCAVAIAGALGRHRPDWELAAGRLAHAVAHRPCAFEPKHRYAMDWYYPVLCGAVGGEAGRARMAQGWPTFVMDGLGVRCVSDRPWVTSAETAECSLACSACGMDEEAGLLLSWVGHLRAPDGSYWTGRVFPEGVDFPLAERSTYSAAAVLLAQETLVGSGPAAAMFRGVGLPGGLLTEPALCSDAGAGPP